MGDIGVFTFSKREGQIAPIKDSKNYNGIDLIKFLCAILVFILHIPPFQGEVSGVAVYVNLGLQHFVCRIAVPFYFVSSGFFLFKKMPLYELDKDIIKAYCFKILRLLGIWHVLLFDGGTKHLWYLGATVIAVILLSLCLHFHIRLGHIYIIAGVLYVIGLLGDSYYGILAPLENIALFQLVSKGYMRAFSTTRNGVFMGFIFVLMGATFSNSGIKLKTRPSLIGLAVSMLCLLVEAFLLKSNNISIEYNMYVFLLPATFFLFSFASTVQLKDRAIYKHLRSIGMIIYFTHIIVNKFASLAVSVVDKKFGIELANYQFILSLLFTLLIAMFIDWLSCKDRFKWINWFIS